MSSEINSVMKRMAVLYHYPCHDGVFAALAAHLYSVAASVPALFFPNTVYSPIRPEQLPLDDISDLYLLDFVGPPGFAAQISSKVDKVVILDHHKTAFETLVGPMPNVTKVLDMDRNGAIIALDYFKQKLVDEPRSDGKILNEFQRMRRVFEYVEDGDLWRWNLPDSKAFNSGLMDLNIEYSTDLNPSLFDKLLALDLEATVSCGKVSLSHKQKLIDETLEKSYAISIGKGLFGYCLAVDADAVSELRSELGYQLANESRSLNLRGIGAVVYRVPEIGNDDTLKISLRSVDEEDTTQISQRFGGGGHRNASSFMLSSTELSEWKMDNKDLA